MPHLTLEYSGNLSGFAAADALLDINRALLASGHFEEADIKSRAVALDACRIGVHDLPRGFIHAKLAILSGRSPEEKQRLSELSLQALADSAALPSGLEVQLCVEIQEIDRASYRKRLIAR
ncbi:5-carboxymethyl-2-hydroxymuconate isomerase [Chromobacterium alkanivorans]|uniref:5-carboxymethyl-2-hydroxymuconate Delta-isomerase n=1 Tax=Chromobacterium alkanivorans TaxID=1071719 RepID=UPI0019689460|nr:5-carboxymethyl-2-hydroxymuconate Delta-isomerase [Chromobacterium alkanivorans]MBN3003448.1 5-carboxymethyl-2-hydroxymuconate Delta-isomerase [Chromobacterium alkanivorans]MCS3804210.1 5-carboxymethyl-2-hydroxymuconate isomerase [Chromobacterium alkanivorans]MCS3818570.1 5-carboxymethyl-2-hydroxymuconate isomerase [Chromobacterium alkanivorans]MCS3873495.1 5-carboxymethyl-2-hydroxymuconate isomerase [Chromobacterium alkanivorans]